MMEVYAVPPTPIGLFKDGRFDPAYKTENSKLFEGQPGFIKNEPIGCRDWSFTEYPPERAAHLYHNWKKCFSGSKVNPGVKKAYEQGLRLLEICTGDYGNPRYIAVVPGLDVEALKKRWHRDHYRFYRVVTWNTPNAGNAHSKKPSAAAPNPKEEGRR